MSDNQREALEAAFIEGNPTLSQSLLVVQTLWPDNVRVLPSAWSSAEDAAKFIRKKEAFDLLKKLATDYRNAYANGKTEMQARELFGKNEYAFDEGDKSNNKNTCDRRTFSYNGEQVTMLKHLKIGVKDSVAETLRIHFYWNSEDKVIVIGHCGKHLDHN